MRFEWGVLETVLVFGHLADHVVEDAAVMEVRQLHVRVEPHLGLKRSPCVQLDVDSHSGRDLWRNDHSVSLAAAEPEAFSAVTRQILQRDDAHPDQITAMNPLVTLR